MATLMKTDLRFNVSGILADFVGFGTALSFLSFDTLLPLLVFTLTGNQTLVGLLGTLWVGCWLLPQMAAGRWMAGRPRKKPVLVGAAIVSRVALAVFVVLLAVGESIPSGVMFVCLVAAIAIFRGLDAVAAVAWFDLVSRVLPPTVRAQVFGSGQALSNVFRFGASLVVTAAIAGGLIYPRSYMTLYGFAVLALGVSMVGLIILREPAAATDATMSGRLGFAAHALHVLRTDGAFRQMTIARLLVGLFDLARPQYIVHATQELGLPDSNIGLFIAAQTVGGVVASLLLARLSARRGSKAAIRVTALLAAGVPLLALALHTLGHDQTALAMGGYIALYALIGSIDASFLIGFLSYVLEIAPEGELTSYTGLSNTIAGIVVVMPTIGGFILQLTSYPVLFVCATMGGVLATLSIRRLPATQPAGAR
jgi:MFS family permease